MPLRVAILAALLFIGICVVSTGALLLHFEVGLIVAGVLFIAWAVICFSTAETFSQGGR
jgi:hypothetical protein